MISKGSWVALETCSAESPIANKRCAVSVLASCLPSALPFSIPFSIPSARPFSIPSFIPISLPSAIPSRLAVSTEFLMSRYAILLASKLIYLSSTCFIINCIKNPCRKVTTLFSNPQEISRKSFRKCFMVVRKHMKKNTQVVQSANSSGSIKQLK